MRRVLAMVTGNGLLTVEGNEHRQMRKVMNPAFALPNIMARASIFHCTRPGQLTVHQKVTCTTTQSKGPYSALPMCYSFLLSANRLIDIIGAQIDSESDSKSDGKIILMYEWRTSFSRPNLRSLTLF